MIGVLGSELNVVGDYGVPCEIRFQGIIIDATVKFKFDVFLSSAESEAVIGKHGGSIEKKVVAEQMIPSQRCGGIPPWNFGFEAGGFAFELKSIPTNITAEEDPIFI